MRTLPPNTASTRAVCVTDLRIQLLVAVCVGMAHMIFSGSSNGAQTAPNGVFKFTYISFMFSLRPLLRTQVVSYLCNYTPASEVYMVYSFRHFKHHICVCLCIFVV